MHVALINPPVQSKRDGNTIISYEYSKDNIPILVALTLDILTESVNRHRFLIIEDHTIEETVDEITARRYSVHTEVLRPNRSTTIVSMIAGLVG